MSEKIPTWTTTRKENRYKIDQSWGKGGFSKEAAVTRAKWDRSSGHGVALKKIGKKYYMYTTRFI